MSRETVITDVGVAIYPKIDKPDTYGPKADGKYKTDFGLTAAQMKAFVAKVQALAADEFGPKRKVVFQKNAAGDAKFGLKEQEGGLFSFRASSKYAPLVIDGKNEKIEEADLPKIGGGTRMRLAVGINFYDETKTSVNVSFYLNQVQIIELKEYQSGGGGKSAFEEVDGAYVAEKRVKADETDDTSEDGGGGDEDGEQSAFDKL